MVLQNALTKTGFLLIAVAFLCAVPQVTANCFILATGLDPLLGGIDLAGYFSGATPFQSDIHAIAAPQNFEGKYILVSMGGYVECDPTAGNPPDCTYLFSLIVCEGSNLVCDPGTTKTGTVTAEGPGPDPRPITDASGDFDVAGWFHTNGSFQTPAPPSYPPSVDYTIDGALELCVLPTPAPIPVSSVAPAKTLPTPASTESVEREFERAEEGEGAP